MRSGMRNFAGAVLLMLVLAVGANTSPVEPGLAGTNGHHSPPVVVSAEAVERAHIALVAPDKGLVGELIRLDVSTSIADSFKWLLVPDSVDFEVYDGGRRAVFSARKVGSYMFVVACAKDGFVDVMTHVVHIVNPGDPDPTIEYPVVEKPSPEAGLMAWIPYWCAEAKREPGEALALAESFESIAAAIAGGAYTTPEEISQATGQANRVALGESLANWMPVLSKLQTELKRQADAGHLKTPEQHAKIWREIAEGLLAYATMFDPR